MELNSAWDQVPSPPPTPPPFALALLIFQSCVDKLDHLPLWLLGCADLYKPQVHWEPCQESWALLCFNYPVVSTGQARAVCISLTHGLCRCQGCSLGPWAELLPCFSNQHYSPSLGTNPLLTIEGIFRLFLSLLSCLFHLSVQSF